MRAKQFYYDTTFFDEPDRHIVRVGKYQLSVSANLFASKRTTKGDLAFAVETLAKMQGLLPKRAQAISCDPR